MRGIMLLHAVFIFFSSILVCLLVPGIAIALFLAGFFLMFMAVGTIYHMRVLRIVLISLAPTLLVVATILYMSLYVASVSLAFGLLEFFYVLQAVFWPFVLAPLIAQQYYVYGKPYAKAVSALAISILSMLLSLVTAAMPIYALTYLAFCIIMYVLEKEYGSERSQTSARAEQ